MEEIGIGGTIAGFFGGRVDVDINEGIWGLEQLRPRPRQLQKCWFVQMFLYLHRWTLRNIFKSFKKGSYPLPAKKSVSWKFSEHLDEICAVSDIIKLMYLA